MTDPKYSDNPQDPAELWNEVMAPPLSADPATSDARAVVVAVQEQVLDDSWLARWRTTLLDAEGYQLDADGAYLWPRPAGWTDDRYRAVILALLPAAFSRITPPVITVLADALLDVGQSVTRVSPTHCTTVFTFLATSLDDATSYASALEVARPRGCRYFINYVPSGVTPFTVGISAVGGTDQITATL